MFKAHMEPRAAGKVLSISSRHFYGLWYGPWKIVVDLLFSITIFFLRKQPALRDMLRHFYGLFKQ